MLSSRSLPAGTMLYGVPMQSSTYMTINGVPQGGFGLQRPSAAAMNLVWCIPVKDGVKWSATCLPTQACTRYTILKGQSPTFEVASLRYDGGTSTNDGATPVVERPGDFGRSLAYRFRIEAITPQSVTIAQDTLFGDETVFTRPHAAMLVPSQKSGLVFGSGAITLAEAADDKVLIAKIALPKPGKSLTVQSGVMQSKVPPQ